ncbi:MAG: hypothetical protein MZU97_08660 [Bacillus subtilis]|nr:hypothetical protein [Bacillus subtilis]
MKMALLRHLRRASARRSPFAGLFSKRRVIVPDWRMRLTKLFLALRAGLAGAVGQLRSSTQKVASFSVDKAPPRFCYNIGDTPGERKLAYRRLRRILRTI